MTRRPAAGADVVPVFGYGSLCDPVSTGETLGLRLPAPRPATLPGHAIGWCVGTDTRGLTDRHWRLPVTEEPGAVFDGVIASLGLLTRPDARCRGVIQPVPAVRLPLLHARERDYTPVLRPAVLDDGTHLEVLTYLPLPAASAVLERGVRQGRAVVTAEYLALLPPGPGTPLPPCPVVSLVFHEGPPGHHR